MTCLLFRLITKDKYVSFFCAWIPCYFVLLLGLLFKARTLCTSTKALTAQFEHTILITDVGHEAGRNVLEKGAFLVRGDSRMQPTKVCVSLHMYYVQICLHRQLYFFCYFSFPYSFGLFGVSMCILGINWFKGCKDKNYLGPFIPPAALWLGSRGGKREVSYRKNQDGGLEMASKSRYNSQVANVGRCWLVHVLTTKPSRMSRWMTAATVRCKTCFFFFFSADVLWFDMICYTIFCTRSIPR